MADKVYPYLTSLKCVISGILFLIFCALSELYFPLFPLPFLFFISAVIMFLTPVIGLNIREIVIGKEGVIFNRRFRPIVMQKITDVEEKRNVLRLTGTTPEGKTVRKPIGRGDIGKKKWDEFKEDIQKIKSK